MFLCLWILSAILDIVSTAYLGDYEEITHRFYMPSDEIEFEPVTVLTKEKEKYISARTINCDDFARFALNCTVEAALLYNSSRMSPPMPAKIGDWCSIVLHQNFIDGRIIMCNWAGTTVTLSCAMEQAIKHLVNCAIDWNADCKDVTQDHFNEEGIKGHIHVSNSICDDEWFLTRYDDLSTCIESSANTWETCFSTFKALVEREKNTTHEWTHYETHFNLCCARTKFRRCTLELIFHEMTNCSYENAVTLQKFSVIVSEGAVYQDCDRNMMYENCPGGDPRPSKSMLAKLMNADAFNGASNRVSNKASKKMLRWTDLMMILVFKMLFCNKHV